MKALYRCMLVLALAGLGSLFAALPPSLAAPLPPTLVAPLNGSTVSSLPVVLRWNASSGATSYHVQVDAETSFSPPLAFDGYLNGTSRSIDSLANGTYYWRVAASDGGAYGAWSDRWSFILCAPPDYPMPTSPWCGEDNINGTNTVFDWNDVAGATSYHIQVDDGGTFDSPIVNTITTASTYTYPGTLPRGTYAWRVRSINNCGSNGWHGFCYFYVGPLPATPTLISPANGAADVHGSGVYLDWADANLADSYNVLVYRSPDGTCCLVASGHPTVSSYTVPTTLGPGTYYWCVYGVNASGIGHRSAMWSFSVCSPSPPDLLFPADGALVGPTGILLDWADVAGATQYLWQVDEDPAFGSPLFAAPPTSRWLIDGPLAPGTYHWRVKATNTCGWGPWSWVRDFTVCAAPPAAAPSLVAPAAGATVGRMNITLDWTDVAGATGYSIQADDDPGFGSPLFTATSAGSTVILGWALDTGTYYWRVRAHNPCGEGPWSSVRSLVACDAVAAAPALLAPANGASVDGTGIDLDWNDVANATAYQVQVGSDATLASPRIDASPGTSAYTLPGELPPGTYYWRARGKNICSAGPWSAIRSFIVVPCTAPPAAAPGLLAPADGAAVPALGILLDWQDVAEATRYRVQIGTAAGLGSPLLDRYADRSRLVVTDPLPVGTYYWRVRPRNGCGDAPWSAVRSFRVLTPARQVYLPAGMNGRR